MGMNLNSGVGVGVVAKLRRLDAYSSTEEVRTAYSKISEHLAVLSYNHSPATAWLDGDTFIFYVNEIMDARMTAIQDALNAVDSGPPSWRFYDVFRAHGSCTRQIFNAMRCHPSYPYVLKDHPDFSALLAQIESAPDIPAVFQ